MAVEEAVGEEAVGEVPHEDAAVLRVAEVAVSLRHSAR